MLAKCPILGHSRLRTFTLQAYFTAIWCYALVTDEMWPEMLKHLHQDSSITPLLLQKQIILHILLCHCSYCTHTGNLMVLEIPSGATSITIKHSLKDNHGYLGKMVICLCLLISFKDKLPVAKKLSNVVSNSNQIIHNWLCTCIQLNNGHCPSNTTPWLM